MVNLNTKYDQDFHRVFSLSAAVLEHRVRTTGTPCKDQIGPPISHQNCLDLFVAQIQGGLESFRDARTADRCLSYSILSYSLGIVSLWDCFLFTVEMVVCKNPEWKSGKRNNFHTFVPNVVDRLVHSNAGLDLDVFKKKLSRCI